MNDELYTDFAVFLKRNGYPPKTIDVTYYEIMKQVENYKRYEVRFTPDRKAETYNFSAPDTLSMAEETPTVYGTYKEVSYD